MKPNGFARMTSARLANLKTFADTRIALMLALGFSSGLPFLLVFSTLSAWLREAGVSRTEIGFLSYLALAYTLKFLWAPIIDAFDVPVLSRFLGRRRAWMMTSQALIALGLLGVSLGDPATNLVGVAACASLVAFASATQDVVIDGWRIDAMPASKQGVMAAAYQLGYRLALICAGAGALYIADFVSWSAAYRAMAGLTLVGLLASLFAPIVDRHETAGGQGPDGEGQNAPRWSFGQAIVEPVADLFRRKGPVLGLILAMVALYRLPDFVSGVMANPLYIDLGFSKSEIASVSKLYGVWIGIAGAFAGGIAITRLGLYRTLFIGAVAGAASNLMFSWLALEGAKLELLIAAISIDNFCGGFAGTVLIAFMSGLTGAGFAATQYALLSSLYALPGKVVGGISGVMVDAFGYPVFFALTAAVGIPVALLCVVVARLSPQEEVAESAPASDAAPAAASPAVPAPAAR